MTTDEPIIQLVRHLRAVDEVGELDYTLADYMDPEVLRLLSAMDDATWNFTVKISDHQVRINHDGRLYIDGQLRTRDFLNTTVGTGKSAETDDG